MKQKNICFYKTSWFGRRAVWFCLVYLDTCRSIMCCSFYFLLITKRVYLLAGHLPFLCSVSDSKSLMCNLLKTWCYLLIWLGCLKCSTDQSVLKYLLFSGSSFIFNFVELWLGARRHIQIPAALIYHWNITADRMHCSLSVKLAHHSKSNPGKKLSSLQLR